LTAKPVLQQAGFAGGALDVALGVSWAESEGYSDAVGDYLQLQDPAVSAKWGPSIGLFQIRSLRDPNAWGVLDRWRVRDLLLDPLYNARAAYAISLSGTDWHLWTTYRTGSYLSHAGDDYEIRTGHPAFSHLND
jgi:hypothetical protein